MSAKNRYLLKGTEELTEILWIVVINIQNLIYMPVLLLILPHLL